MAGSAVTGSDRAADRWREDYAIAGVAGLDLPSVAEAQKLPVTSQAQAVYELLGLVADKLVDFGFDPNVVAHAALDLGFDLNRLYGGPAQVVRIDPRRKGDEDEPFEDA